MTVSVRETATQLFTLPTATPNSTGKDTAEC